MINPQHQWAIQIDVTDACPRRCSNCTRFIGHRERKFFMPVEQFAEAAEALKDFPTASPPVSAELRKFTGGRKVVGILGGEPLLHPEFAELAAILEHTVPSRENRGLWTGLQWQNTPHAAVIERVFGYVNNNRHDHECLHSPILVALADVVPSLEDRKKLIDDCWLQRLWSSTINPKGFWFCEVAGAMSILFDGPDGLPVEPECWRRPLADFQYQIDFACHRCGVPLNLQGRQDFENMDDVSQSNLDALTAIGSPRVREGRFVLREKTAEDMDVTEAPWRYLQ